MNKSAQNILKDLSTGISQDDPIIKALLSNEIGKGAVANELERINEFIDAFTTINNVYQQQNTVLDKTIKFFTNFVRFLDEKDISLKKRIKSLMVRKGDEIWGTSWNIKHVFEEFVIDSKIYVVENTNDIRENLIVNGDFDTYNNWIFNNCYIDNQSRFSGDRGLHFNGEGSVSQKVNLEKGSYFLHTFIKGKISVVIKKSDNEYWDFKNKIWSKNICKNKLSSDEWDNEFIYFILKTPGEVDISYICDTAYYESFIDYIRLFKKNIWSSFSVIIQNDSYISRSTDYLHLSIGNFDENELISDYSKESYFDDAVIFGADYDTITYKDILEVVRPCGIKSHVEFLERVYLEQEDIIQSCFSNEGKTNYQGYLDSNSLLYKNSIFYK